MVVSQQIDAMRALGTDPNRKLVAPRIIALIFMLPLLTVAADIFGIIGGGIVANTIFNQDTNVYITIGSIRHYDRRYYRRNYQTFIFRLDYRQHFLLQRFKHDGRNGRCRIVDDQRGCVIFDLS